MLWHKLYHYQLPISVLLSAAMIVCTNLITTNENWLELLFMVHQVVFKVLIFFWFKEMQRGWNRKLDNLKNQCGSLQAAQYRL